MSAAFWFLQPKVKVFLESDMRVYETGKSAAISAQVEEGFNVAAPNHAVLSKSKSCVCCFGPPHPLLRK